MTKQYICFLNGEVYGIGDLSYMQELFDNYVITCRLYERDEVEFKIVEKEKGLKIIAKQIEERGISIEDHLRGDKMNEVIGKHTAIVQGRVYRNLYKAKQGLTGDYSHSSLRDKDGTEVKLYMEKEKIVIAESYSLIKSKELASHETIWIGEMDSPLLKVGEKLYVGELDLEVVISERLRHSNGAYIYRTGHEIRVIDDKRSEESKEKAEKDFEYLKAVVKKSEEKIVELEAQLEKERQEEHDNYYDENGLLRAFPKNYVEENSRKRSWIRRVFG